MALKQAKSLAAGFTALGLAASSAMAEEPQQTSAKASFEKPTIDAYYGSDYTLQNMDALIVAAPQCEINPVSMPDFGKGIAVRYQIGDKIIDTRKVGSLGAAMSETEDLCGDILTSTQS